MHPPPASNNPAQLLAALLAQAPPPNQQIPLPYMQNNSSVTFPPQLPVSLAPQPTPVAGQSTYGNMPPAPPPVNSNPLAAFMSNPQLNAHGGAGDANVANQMQALQQLAQNPEAFKTVLQALGIPVPQLPAAQVPQLSQVPAALPVPQNTLASFGAQPPYAAQSYDRDEDGYNQRNRSRSPDYKRRRVSPPNRRDSPTYGTYDPHASENDPRGQDDRGRGRGRKGGRNDFRQRSPPASRDSRDEAPIPKSNQPKPLGMDKNIPDGQIKGKLKCNVASHYKTKAMMQY
jgi:protein NRD1